MHRRNFVLLASFVAGLLSAAGDAAAQQQPMRSSHGLYGVGQIAQRSYEKQAPTRRAGVKGAAITSAALSGFGVQKSSRRPAFRATVRRR